MCADIASTPHDRFCPGGGYERCYHYSFPDDHLAKLQEMAARFGVSLEELVRVGVEDLLVRSDDSFQRAVEEILVKNAELYRRLA